MDAEHKVENGSVHAAIDYEHLEPAFELKDFCGYGFNDISLKVYPAKCWVSPVVGAGRTELVSTVFGRVINLSVEKSIRWERINRFSTAKFWKPESIMSRKIVIITDSLHQHNRREYNFRPSSNS